MKEKLKYLLIVLILIISAMIINISRKSYLNYEKNIVSEQQEQLLAISKLAGKSILDYVEEQSRKVAYLGENLEDDIINGKEQIYLKRIKNFEDYHRGQISSLHYINFSEGIDYIYPEGWKKANTFLNSGELFTRVRNYKTMNGTYMGEAYKISENAYVFDILKPIYIEGHLAGVIIAQINVNNMYDLIVKPIKAGKYGYAMVKNNDGIIIMHPVREQIGYDVLLDRKKKYPDLDYKELEELVARQLRGDDGTYTYHSYWWTQKELHKIKKFQAFTSIDLGEDFWVVAVTMAYDEIGGAIKKYLDTVAMTALTLILVIALSIYIIMRMISSKEAHRIETNYLRELNESIENLRRKEIELLEKRKAETIGTLTGGIAHEFNNILTPIMGYSEMILRDIAPGDDHYDEIRTINDSSKKAREVISQVLKFSNKNMKTRYEVLEISEVVEKALKFFEVVTPSNIEIIKNIHGRRGSILANEAQIYQMLLDLCITSYTSMKDTGGRLEVELSTADFLEGSEKRYFKLSMRDKGSELNTSKSIATHLSGVLETISKHGGRLEVEKEPEGGRRINIYLPKVETDIVESSEEVVLKGKERILIVDDEEIIVQMLKKNLEGLGYKVVAYTDPQDVIRGFNNLKGRIDLLITDLNMPEVSGIQLAKKFRRNKPEIGILLATGNVEEPLEEYIKSGLIDGYILKPVSLKILSETIRRVLEG